MIFRKETFMTIKEKLLQEFGAAISAIYGDLENEQYDQENGNIDKGEIIAIAQKVLFYMDL